MYMTGENKNEIIENQSLQWYILVTSIWYRVLRNIHAKRQKLSKKSFEDHV